MRKVMAMVMVCVLMAVCVSACAETVERKGVVVATDWLNCTMLVLTEDGNVWEAGLDDEWCIGDVVLLVMDDQGTEMVADDTIEDMRYIDSMSDAETVDYIESFT